MDGEASSPARCRASNLRFEPSAVSPRAKPENPKGFQPPCHPHQSPLKIEDFSGAEPAGKRFLLWKMRFSDAKIVPCPPYTPLGTIESSRGLRPSRALRGFFDSLSSPFRRAFALYRICLPLDRDGLQCERRGSPTKNSETRTCGSRFRALSRGSRQRRLMISRKLLEIRRIRELEFMVPEFVARIGASRWLSALPTGKSAG